MVGLDSILGYVGFISTLVGWFPTNPDQGQVRIKYWAGRDGWNNGFELKESGGELPKVDIRSTSNVWVGHGTMALQWIGSNDQRQVDVDMSKNQEINYLTFTHDGYDATCLALIGWTPNENGFVGLLNINLDVMGEHFIGDYKGKDLCYWGVGMASGRYPRPKKRSLHSTDEHIAAFGNQVRVHKSLSAIELCDSPTSWGSSFFSIEEGVFCDMSTKTKVPVCKAGETEGCFVYEKPVVNGRGVYSTKRNVGVRGSTKKYNATYFVTRDENGRVLDDGKGH
ncbi:hypothetical protein BGX21_001498 [Mortierella sp. AD011]|nr:hypothetical protein BGX21_001498 [Mortierella sp. AD011]